MYLGLDLGTSGLKALLINDQHEILDVATVPLKVSRLRDGWCEQNPVDWIQALRAVFKKIARRLPSLKSLAISGHMHGVVLLDSQGQVVRPCLLWNDTRARVQAAQLDANPLFRGTTGTMVFPGFSASKLAWVRDEEPEAWSRAASVLFPKDYLAFWLTGLQHSEPSDAAGSALFDCAASRWSAALCDAAALPQGLLPPLVRSDEVRGRVAPAVAAEFGLNPTCLVAGGAGDNAAASLGIGAVRDGQGQISLGTSGVVLAVNDSWMPKAETAVHSFNHAVAGSFIQMGVTLAATDSLTWLADALGKDSADLASLLPQRSRGPGDLIYLPYLLGERTPHNLNMPAGAFIGLGRTHGFRHLTQAVMEGVAYSLADCADALKKAGANLDQLTAVGGGARSPFWVQTLVDVLQHPLRLNPLSDHAAALGAARLAYAAEAGATIQNIVEASPLPQNLRTISPRAEFAAAYQDALARYRSLSHAIRTLH